MSGANLYRTELYRMCSEGVCMSRHWPSVDVMSALIGQSACLQELWKG